MGLGSIVKRIRQIMRNDAGVSGDAQRIEQMVWIIFLKVYDAKESVWEFREKNYRSIIPEKLRWRNWAVDRKDGNALTADALLRLVNGELFPTLQNLEVDETTPTNKAIVKAVFEDNNNYMKDGVLLRQVINVIDEIDFDEYEDRHAFGEIYESILKELQSAGSAGEFYTPRADTDFIVQMLAPKLGEHVADFACGTGGFLTSTLKVLEPQVKSVRDRRLFNESVFGIEKKPLPYLLCVTNMLLHDVDAPRIYHGNSLERDVRSYKAQDKFDVIVMNPPYGGGEKDGVKMNFPADLRSSETADLFMSVIMYRLKKGGRHRAGRIHVRNGGGKGGNQAEAPQRVQPAHDHPPAAQRLRALHGHHDEHPLLRQHRADGIDVDLPARHAGGHQALLEDQADGAEALR